MINQSEILKDLKNHLAKYLGDSIKDVILFGSQATGKSTEFSDYDILIILDHEYSGEDESMILDLCYDIDLKYDILLDVHILSKSELNSIRGRQAVFSKAIKSGIYA
jgi:predicted nucleotidyltransferase